MVDPMDGSHVLSGAGLGLVVGCGVLVVLIGSRSLGVTRRSLGVSRVCDNLDLLLQRLDLPLQR